MYEDEEDSLILDKACELKRAVIKLHSIKCESIIKFPCSLWASIKDSFKQVAECTKRVKI